MAFLPPDNKALLKIYEKTKKELSDEKNLPPSHLKPQIDLAVAALSECVKKLKTALILPKLLENSEDLREFMTPMQIIRFKKFCKKYVNSQNSKGEEDVEDDQVDFHLIKAIELVYYNKKMDLIIDKYYYSIDFQLKSFWRAVNCICDILKIRLNTTPSMELQNEKILHSIYHKTLKVKASKLAIKAQLQNKEVNVQWKLAEKQALITKYSRDLSDRKWQNNIKIQTYVIQANKKMNEMFEKSELNKAELESNATIAKTSYQKTINESAALYKELQDTKNKILSQLQGWIKKYDKDVREKLKEKDDIKNVLSDRTKEFDEFFMNYEKQEIIYKNILKAKETEEKIAQEEKLMLFIMNRSARIIQKYWRKHHRIKKKKGKGKGRRGKKRK